MSTEVAVNEMPILFNAPMIRALLSGAKTQTRRVVTPKTSTVLGYNVSEKSLLWRELDWTREVMKDKGPHAFHGSDSEYLHVWCKQDEKRYRVRCRMDIGDRLWVRENCVRFTGIPNNGWPWPRVPEWRLSPDGDPYKALLPAVCDNFVAQLNSAAACVSVPSIHMPRWASRIALEITGVRVERVREITPADARAEGMTYSQTLPHLDSELTACFAYLWDSLNEASGFGWDANPWVWVVEFRRLA